MVVTVFAISSYKDLSKYEVEYAGEIGLVTPQFVGKIVRDAKLKGKAFILQLGDRTYYAAKIKDGYLVYHSTATASLGSVL